MRTSKMGGILVLAGGSVLAGTLPAVAAVEFSSDITAPFGSVVARDEDWAADNASTLAALGSLPPQADLSAIHLLPNGDRLVAFDITFTLPGGLVYRPGDVVRWNGVTYTLEFDASANAIPTNARVDAITHGPGGELLLSLDITALVNGLVVSDEDVFYLDGTTPVMFFDGSAAGVPLSTDLDGMHYDPASNSLLISFDTGGLVGGVNFSDEDVVAYDRDSTTWSLLYDGSTAEAAWLAADLDALYLGVLPEELFKDSFEAIPGP